MNNITNLNAARAARNQARNGPSFATPAPEVAKPNHYPSMYHEIMADVRSCAKMMAGGNRMLEPFCMIDLLQTALKRACAEINVLRNPVDTVKERFELECE